MKVDLKKSWRQMVQLDGDSIGPVYQDAVILIMVIIAALILQLSRTKKRNYDDQ